MSIEVAVTVDNAFDVASVGNSSVVAHTHPATDINNSTEVGRNILTATSAAAQRASLGLDTTANQTFTVSGGASRSVQSKLADIVSVKDFGAVGDGVTDDTAAIQLALNSNNAIYFPAGSYVISSLLTVSGGKRIIGAGISLTSFIVSTASFLKVTDGATFARTQISDFTVLANTVAATSSYGIKAEFSNYGTLRNSIAIHNIQFRGNDGVIQSTLGFEKYIWVQNALSGECRYIRIEGGYFAVNDPTGQLSTTGVHVDSQSVGFLIDHCNFNAVHTGVLADSITEGLQVAFSEFVGVRDGFNVVGSQPGVWITSSHVNSTRTGAWLDDRSNVSITNCSFYRSSFFFAETYNAISAKNCVGVEVNGCEVVNSLLSGTSRGIYAESGNSSINVSSLTLRTLSEGLTHGGSNNGCHYGSVTFNACTTCFTTATSDANIHLYRHSILGSTTTRYSIATNKNTITVDRGRNILTRLIGNATVTAAGTTLLSVDTSEQVQRFAFGAGTGPYTYNIDLDSTNARVGDYFDIYLTIGSSSNPTVLIRNGSGGSTLATINVTVFKRYSMQFHWAGSGWVAHYVVESLY